MSKLSVSINAADHFRGDAGAPCSLLEYGDYECPSCSQIEPVLRQLQHHFGEQLSFVFRNFPLNEIHPSAEQAAEAAEFAGQYGKFWEMHDKLFPNQSSFSEDMFLELGEKVGLSRSGLRVALQEHTYRPRVRKDCESGIRSGVNGTPTLFINEQGYDGSLDFDSLANAVNRVLGKTAS